MTQALLLSGGMDSVSIAYWLRPKHAITIDYGHGPAAGELRASAAICRELSITHHIIVADISALGSGDLVGTVPSANAPASEWWPYRNQFLLTLAAMKCHQLGVEEILIGALKTDGFHADSTPQFLTALNATLGIQEGTLQVKAPAIDLTAEELVKESGIAPSLLYWSHSCHLTEYACGFCRGCQKHYLTMEACFGEAF
jgi:7-cyano-7-deazaguanine synthase